MASSSTSSLPRSCRYDVFLSFFGEETFVDHLYEALRRKGIIVFKDSERFPPGIRIDIEETKLFVIIFSKNYASSAWCLRELVEIMECHAMNDCTVYPVFYDVDPSEVRSLTGKVGEAFLKHEDMEGEKEIRKWREALEEAGSMDGFDLKSFNGYESWLIEAIVVHLSVELHPIKVDTDTRLIGMEARIERVLPVLETGNDKASMIGIVGLGGGGKTTLARAVFDRISTQFEGKSFVEDVRGLLQAPSSSLQSLQKQVLTDVLNDQCFTVAGVHTGKNMIRNLLTSRKVLVVLDNVDHIDQLEALAGSVDWFGPGSIIIFTTRDNQLLNAHGVALICSVNLLSNEESMVLFNCYAFGSKVPVQEYLPLSHQIVRHFDGVPLTIKVLGSSLCGRNVHEWKDALIRLENFPLKDTMRQLELSYVGLKADVQDIFLDVACFLKGLQKENVIRILESCGFKADIGLSVLEEKCLVTFNGDQDLVMHPLIEEMGQDIVRRSHPNEPNKHSRLWLHDEIEYILANNLGTEATIAVAVDNSSGKLSSGVVTKGFGSMRKLRLLRVVSEIDDDCDVKIGQIGLNFPSALQFLCWERYPHSSLPKTFKTDNLVTLEMPYSRIIHLWEGGEIKVLNNLKFLNLRHSLLETLDLRQTSKLQRVDLEGCNHLVELQMPRYRNCLKFLNLRHTALRTLDVRLFRMLGWLDLEGCDHLVELQMPSYPICLKFLNLRHSQLTTLNLQQASKLERLDLEGCNHLIQLQMPSDPVNLKFLKLKYSVELHTPTGCLQSLKYLNLSGCLKIESLVFVKGLKRLEDLSLTHLDLKKFPDIISQPNSLLELRFSYNDIEELPSSIANLQKLVYLDLSFCTELRSLPESICDLQQLRNLKLNGCPLEDLPQDIGRLECLEKLNLSFARIRQLPDTISNLKRLKSLNLSSCLCLEKLPQDIGQLQCLQKLILTECTKLREIPDDICMLKSLEYLSLQDCIQIEKLPKGFNNLQSLKVLNVKGTCITHLPRSISSLTDLQIYGSEQLCIAQAPKRFRGQTSRFT